MNGPMLLGRLYALREVLDATIAAVEFDADAAEGKPICAHPLEQREHLGQTMGTDAGFKCRLCGAVVPAGESASTTELTARIVRPSQEGAM